MLFAAVLFAGCATRSLDTSMQGDAATTQDLDAPDLVVIDLAGVDLVGADLRPAPITSVAIGDGCTLPPIQTEEGPQQGTCSDGMQCFSEAGYAPGGYCTQRCDMELQDCPAGSVCGSLPTNFCLKLCKKQSDCRMGYICDSELLPGVSVCSVPFPAG